MSESAIQKSILQYLATLPWVFAWRANAGNIPIQGKGGVRMFKGNITGCADIIGMMQPRGRFLAIEVKKPGGKQTAYQKDFEQRVILMGGLYLLATSVDDIINVMKELKP